MTNVSPVNNMGASGAADVSAAPAVSFFFFERHRDVGIGGQANPSVALDLRDQAL